MPELLAVCRGQVRELTDAAGRVHVTGIVKEPVDGPVEVGEGGVLGDVVRDVTHHGGSDQALYAYAATDYDHFVADLGQVLPYGTFGENLVVDAWGTDRLEIGDRLRVGEDVVCEVTSPRIPCAKFAAKMLQVAGIEKSWVKRFSAARRPGAYLRVLAAGEIEAGMPVVLEPGGSGYALLDLWDLAMGSHPTREQLERALAAPIASRDRRWCEQQLAA